MTDSERLDFLSDLISRTPDLEIYWNDDDATEDADGMMPLGFTIRVDSPCVPLLKVSAISFRDCIDIFRDQLGREAAEETAHPRSEGI